MAGNLPPHCEMIIIDLSGLQHGNRATRSLQGNPFDQLTSEKISVYGVHPGAPLEARQVRTRSKRGLNTYPLERIAKKAVRTIGLQDDALRHSQLVMLPNPSRGKVTFECLLVNFQEGVAGSANGSAGSNSIVLLNSHPASPPNSAYTGAPCSTPQSCLPSLPHAQHGITEDRPGQQGWETAQLGGLERFRARAESWQTSN